MLHRPSHASPAVRKKHNRQVPHQKPSHHWSSRHRSFRRPRSTCCRSPVPRCPSSASRKSPHRYPLPAEALRRRSRNNPSPALCLCTRNQRSRPRPPTLNPHATALTRSRAMIRPHCAPPRSDSRPSIENQKRVPRNRHSTSYDRSLPRDQRSACFRYASCN